MVNIDVEDLPFGDVLDRDAFMQILEMDEPDSREFSYGIIYDFFEQAEETVTRIQDSLTKKDLPALAALGHFLKGSSLTLGFAKVQASCEKIQRYGKREKLDGSPAGSSQECLGVIKVALDDVVRELSEVRNVLDDFYRDTGHENDDDDDESNA